MQEQFYTVAEAAEILKVSTDTVTRMFEDEPGVVDLGSPEQLHKRRYRVLAYLTQSSIGCFIRNESNSTFAEPGARCQFFARRA